MFFFKRDLKPPKTKMYSIDKTKLTCSIDSLFEFRIQLENLFI